MTIPRADKFTVALQTKFLSTTGTKKRSFSAIPSSVVLGHMDARVLNLQPGLQPLVGLRASGDAAPRTILGAEKIRAP